MAFGKKEEKPQTLPVAKEPNKQELTTQVMTADEQKAMYGDMGQEHISIPRIVILEQLSPEVGEKLGQSGEFFVKGINLNLGAAPLELVVLMRAHTRIRWKEIKMGGGILCQAIDGFKGVGNPGGDCSRCSLKEWNGSQQPQCDLYENFIVVTRKSLQDGEPTVMALSGARTRLKGLKDFNTMLFQLMQQKRPLFTKSYLVKAQAKKNPKIPGNNEYHVFQVQVGNQNAPLPKAEQDAAYQVFKGFAGRRVVVEQNSPDTPQEAAASPGTPGF